MNTDVKSKTNSVQNKIVKLILFTVFINLLLLMVLGNFTLAASAPYSSYVYNYWGEPVTCPQPYEHIKTIRGQDLGIQNFNNPQDIFVSANNHIYLLDTDNNRIVCLNENYKIVRVINEFNNKGTKDSFNQPEGLYVTEDERIYVADTGNNRVIILDNNGKFIKEIGTPKKNVKSAFSQDFIFKPLKIGVDLAGRIYVISKDVYEGFIVFQYDGKFNGFMGAPKVTPDPIDLVWRQFSTEAQRERQSIFLPTEFSNIDIGSQGFIYSLTKGLVDKKTIKRLNPSGDDILTRSGFHPPVGDRILNVDTNFTDIMAYDGGFYSVLDKHKGRIFTYDEYGNLLYVFGGKGDQKSLFSAPQALDIINGKILVLDSDKKLIHVFEPTPYTKTVKKAITNYNKGYYDSSQVLWKQVLNQNANYDLAYQNIGKVFYRQKKYQKAMKNFKLGQDREGYSKAFRYYRQQILESNFGLIIKILIIIIALVYIFKKVVSSTRINNYWEKQITSINSKVLKRNSLTLQIKHILKSLRYCFHIIFHPFDGFWELKHERKNNLAGALVLLIILTGTYIFMKQETGFIFNPRNLEKINILKDIISVVLPFLLWCSVNWGLTTLMEGKGTFREVFIASAFSFIPFILMSIPLTLLSNYMTLQEETFLTLFKGFALFWSLGLLFFGNMMTHEYEVIKTLLTSILTIIGIGIVLFFGFLFFSLINELYSFINTIIIEVSYRI